MEAHENKNLNQKLLRLQASVKALAKNADAFGYSYVNGSKLLYFIRPKMDELGLRLVPHTVSVEQQIIETSPATDKKPAKREILVLLHKQYTWIDVESGESETTDFYSQGCNGWDKAIGSAETYAERYFLLKYFHIATDEDDVDALRNEAPAPTPAPQPEPEVAQKKRTTKKAPVKKETPQPESQPEPAEAPAPTSAPTPAPTPAPASAVANTLDEAVALATNAISSAELFEIWGKNKDQFGKDLAFVSAIALNPYNPKKR